MVCHRDPRVGRRRTLLVTLATALLIVFSPSAAAEESEDGRLGVSGPDSVPRPGSRVRFEIVVPSDADSDDIEVAELDLPDILAPDAETVIETGRSMPGEPGRRAVRVRIETQAARPGRAVLESFLIRAGDDEFTTRPKIVEVAIPGSDDKIPFSVEWRTARDYIYRNEVIPVTLVIRNAVEYAFPESLELSSPDSGELIEVQVSEDIERREIDGRTLLTIPVARYLFSADTSGRVTLPEVEITAGEFEELTPRKALEVRELPDEARESTAVGGFGYDAELDREQIPEGESAIVTIRVSGVGNLPFLQIPGLEAEDLVVTQLDENADIEPASGGYRGSVELTYRVTPRSTGMHLVRVPPFVWVDAHSGELRRSTAPAMTLEVTEARTGTTEPEPGEAELTPLSLDEIKRIEPANRYRRPETYLWLLPGIIIVLVGISGIVPKRVGAFPLAMVLLIAAGTPEDFPDDRVERALEAHREGRFEAAVAAYDTALQDRPDSPGILYNSALALYNEGAAPQALYRLRQALRANPSAAELSTALSRLEAELGLEQQPEPSRLPHPDAFVIVALVLVNLLCLLAIVAKRLRGGTAVIVAVFGVLLTVGSIGLAAYSARAAATPVAVVGPESGVLRRIPDDGADPWLRLDPGTAVRVLVRHQDYQLVRTGYGVEGWLSSDAIIGTIGTPPPVRSGR